MLAHLKVINRIQIIDTRDTTEFQRQQKFFVVFSGVFQILPDLKTKITRFRRNVDKNQTHSRAFSKIACDLINFEKYSRHVGKNTKKLTMSTTFLKRIYAKCFLIEI
ncbi:hypothetical protein WA026_012145 [Henosepilachna vigintioctopunctata]|uniref:Uncharacterized protein n=1 Tax=Henosepilachna vigintioctopunctata TaxID=420089 RepID=A0AAW1V530_9CUCU